MKIAESAVSLSSTHRKIEERQRSEHLVAWQQGKAPEELDSDKARGQDLRAKAMAFQEQATKVSLSQAGQVQRSHPAKEVVAPLDTKDQPMESLNMRILKAIFEKITGRKFNLRDPSRIVDDIEAAEAKQAAAAQTEQTAGAPAAQEAPAAGWGVAYDSHETHYEQETTNFSAAGIVNRGRPGNRFFCAALHES